MHRCCHILNKFENNTLDIPYTFQWDGRCPQNCHFPQVGSGPPPNIRFLGTTHIKFTFQTAPWLVQPFLKKNIHRWLQDLKMDSACISLLNRGVSVIRPSQWAVMSTLGIMAQTLSTSRYSKSVSCRSSSRRSSSFIDTSCFRLRMLRWTHTNSITVSSSQYRAVASQLGQPSLASLRGS